MSFINKLKQNIFPAQKAKNIAAKFDDTEGLLSVDKKSLFNLEKFSVDELLDLSVRIRNIDWVSNTTLNEIIWLLENGWEEDLAMMFSWVFPYLKKAFEINPKKTADYINNKDLLKEVGFQSDDHFPKYEYWKYEKFKSKITVDNKAIAFANFHWISFEQIINILWGTVLFEKIDDCIVDISINDTNEIMIHGKWDSDLFEVARKINVYSKIIEYSWIRMSDNSKWKWIWLKIMYSQIVEANKLWYNIYFISGVWKFWSEFNWYYSWARYWFEMRHSQQKFIDLCKSSWNEKIAQCTSLIDLMSLEEWRKLWKEKWFGFAWFFDTSKGSRSYEYFMNYYNQSISPDSLSV